MANALNLIEDFLLNSNDRFIRVNELYLNCPPPDKPDYSDTWVIFEKRPFREVSYLDCFNELMNHPWFEIDPKNHNIFKVALWLK